MSASGVQGGETCLHCGGVTVTEAHVALRWVCGACGGPRIMGVPTGTLTEDAARSLKRALKERRASVSAEIARIVWIVFTLMWGALASFAIWAHATVPAISFAALGAGAAVCALLTGRYGRRATRASREALDHAWAEAAKHLLEARGGAMTAPEIAHAMRLAEPDAERVLAQLSAEGAHVRVGEDAELAYDVESANPPDARRAQR